MSDEDPDTEKLPPTPAALAAKEDGPFVLRTLLDKVPLASDSMPEGVKINCVEFYENNLYIGTSAGQLLHFVHIPVDPDAIDSAPFSSAASFIMASRLEPDFAEPSNTSGGTQPGVQQILLLPKVGKACILCNWTVTFYMLPEFSRALGTLQVKNCNWIGGVDLNESRDPDIHGYDGKPGATVLLSLNRRIQVVRINDDARLVRNIDFAGSTITVRRDSIACVADARSYTLLDIDHQLKIPLMKISSLDDSEPTEAVPSPVAGSNGGLSRSNSSAQRKPPAAAGSHSRSTSLGAFVTSKILNTPNDNGGGSGSPNRAGSPVPPTPSKSPEPESTVVQLPHSESAPAVDQLQRSTTPANGAVDRPKPTGFLQGHIVSPSKEEFLLVNGTSPLDPGVGVFVNLDGDPTRPPIGFDRYPKQVVVDDGQPPQNLAQSALPFHMEEDAYVIASMSRNFGDGPHNGLEIQRADSGLAGRDTHWLEPPLIQGDSQSMVGVKVLMDGGEIKFPEIIEKLGQSLFKPFARRKRNDMTFSARDLNPRDRPQQEVPGPEEPDPPADFEEKRIKDERDFVKRLASSPSRIAVWCGDQIWWAVRNPRLLQMEASLHLNIKEESETGQLQSGCMDRKPVFDLLESLKDRDARSELEFLTFNYMRQRAGLLLLFELLYPGAEEQNPFSDTEIKNLEEYLVESGLDPRVVLSLIPGVRNEIIESKCGIWVFGGVQTAVDRYLANEPEYRDEHGAPMPAIDVLSSQVLQFLRRFLVAWRKRKGFGSVAGEKEVFQTVDAALLLVLLEIDRHSPPGVAKSRRSPRAELYEVVDKGIDCFDRAVDMLKAYQRLFVLSRLYQSRKMAGEVLGTWKSIIEGAVDEGGELMEGEQRVRDYLGNVNNMELVREYGLWLAVRNPKLAVEVFAEERKVKSGVNSSARFESTEVVALLKEKAPGAVKAYLEYMVFTKGHSLYVNDLISYFLDSVIDHLQASEENRDALAATYTTYRTLMPPKPSYGRFLADNLNPEDTDSQSGDSPWRNRLRLLQLLSTARGYDAAAIQKRISELPGDLLVPETIILAGKAKHHAEALRLLVQSLGDYDTAVAYCLRGGRSIYGNPSRYSALQQTLVSPATHNFPTSGNGPDGDGDGDDDDDDESNSEALYAKQRSLFLITLKEFLSIQHPTQRLEQTCNLLERYGSWFELGEVLEVIPDTWPLKPMGTFLVSALRRMVQETHQLAISKALAAVNGLRVSEEVVIAREAHGPMVEDPEDGSARENTE